MTRTRNSKKRFNKPPKWFKRMLARIRRAKDANAVKAGKEPEKWKRTDEYDWN